MSVRLKCSMIQIELDLLGCVQNVEGSGLVNASSIRSHLRLRRQVYNVQSELQSQRFIVAIA